MGEFFKCLFQPYHKIWLNQGRQTQALANILKSFTSLYFGNLLSKLPPNVSEEFICNLLMLVHSHRHNKEESLFEENQADFSIVRDPMYKYSKKAEDRFLSNAYLSFFFLFFAQSNFGNQFTYQKVGEKGPEYYGRIKNEIEILKQVAANKICNL